jgi:putative membrane protein
MLRWLLVSLVANAIVLGLTAWILPGVDANGSAWTVFWAALVFAVLNTVLKPVLKVVTFPVALLTLGIAWFFVAMLMLWLTDVIVPSFDIEGFWTFVLATIIVWALDRVVDAVFRDRVS